MPTYTFQCTNEKCNNIFDLKLKISELDSSNITCSKCLNICKRIILGGSGFLLKGERWAADGYSDSVKIKDKEKK